MLDAVNRKVTNPLAISAALKVYTGFSIVGSLKVPVPTGFTLVHNKLFAYWAVFPERL